MCPSPLSLQQTPYSTIPYSFITMDILEQYCETEYGSQCALMLVCMLTNFVLIIPIRPKTMEEVIKAYLKKVYSIYGGSKLILSDRGGEFTSKQFAWLAEE